MNPLEPGHLTVMRIQAAIVAAVLMVAAGVGELINLKVELVPSGLIAAAMAAILIYPTVFAPKRHFRHWAWKVDAEELHIHRGVFTRVETIVPFRRVQHIDVVQGALQRAFHVTSLVLHTAGTIDHKVVVPGLSRETAEQIRDEVRAVIVREADVH